MLNLFTMISKFDIQYSIFINCLLIFCWILIVSLYRFNMNLKICLKNAKYWRFLLAFILFYPGDQKIFMFGRSSWASTLGSEQWQPGWWGWRFCRWILTVATQYWNYHSDCFMTFSPQNRSELEETLRRLQHHKERKLFVENIFFIINFEFSVFSGSDRSDSCQW